MQQTMQYMGQPSTARVTNELARQICQRTQSAAVIEGSIAQIGNTYNLILNALNCASGETLATAPQPKRPTKITFSARSAMPPKTFGEAGRIARLHSEIQHSD